MELKTTFILGLCFTVLAYFLITEVSSSQSYFGTKFLLWNLFLAFVPLVLAYWSINTTSQFKYILLLCWLLFLPNSFYILTDLGHLLKIYQFDSELNRQYLDFSRFDIDNLFSYVGLKFISIALAGWCFGISSIVMIYHYFGSAKKLTQFTMLCICFLSGVGIALGRFYRWNSWDVIHNFGEIHSDLYEVFTTQTGLFTILFFGSLIFVSLTVGRKLA